MFALSPSIELRAKLLMLKMSSRSTRLLRQDLALLGCEALLQLVDGLLSLPAVTVGCKAKGFDFLCYTVLVLCCDRRPGLLAELHGLLELGRG